MINESGLERQSSAQAEDLASPALSYIDLEEIQMRQVTQESAFPQHIGVEVVNNISDWPDSSVG